MAEGSLLKSVTIQRGKNSPSTMCRGAAAAGGGKCYFVSHEDTNIHVYDVEKDDWFAARQALYKCSSLAVIDGQVTTVGGFHPGTFSDATNLLQTLANRRWQTKYPAMVVDTALGIDNKKFCMSVVQSGTSVIVIGGKNNSETQNRVDILDTATGTWTEAHNYPTIFDNGSATVAGDEIYVERNGSAYQCFLDELKDDTKPAGSVWNAIAKPPNTRDWYPTLGSLCGQAVAIGGGESRLIQAYDPDKNSWYEIGKMAIGRTKPLVAQLAEDKIVVAGGISGKCGSGNDVVVTEIITGVV